jgi:lipopolysaccharide/colanic/teichoic acid biosynthesis glycosyltransferase
MSLVGPRADVAEMAALLPREAEPLLRLRPGMTGLATLAFRDEEEILGRQPDPVQFNRDYIYPEKVRLNLEYNRTLSLRCDILLIARTLCAVFTRHRT